MRIALLEDLDQDLNFLNKEIINWEMEHHIPLSPSPDIYHSGEEFLNHFRKDMYDIIFLDIFMKELSGMDTARKIRELDQDCCIIFTTTSVDFAIESYEVNASYYLVKPFTKEKLHQALSRCKAVSMEENQVIVIPGSKGNIRIFLHQIIYTEYVKRYIHVYMKDGSVQVLPMDQKSWTELLRPYSFFCDCMRGILVNLESVIKLGDTSFILEGDIEIPISRLKYNDVREQFLLFSYSKVRKEGI